MASFNLRLAPNLEKRARDYADEIGISINAVISVALNAYLSAEMGPSQGQKDTEYTPPDGNHGDNKINPPLTKKQRQQRTAFDRAQRKLVL